MIETTIRDLVIANRILDREGVLDAEGHISVRHPARPQCFLMSRTKSAAFVEARDIGAFRHDGSPESHEPCRSTHVERFIHGSIYEARPEIMAVVHSHASEGLAYSLTTQPLQPVFHMAAMIGSQIPVWDIRNQFGDTNMLVTNQQQGDDLARTLADNSVVLMRGHGFTAAGRYLIEVIRMCIYLRINAVVQAKAALMGAPASLTHDEVRMISDIAADAPELQRAWQYWTVRAGCEAMS